MTGYSEDSGRVSFKPRDVRIAEFTSDARAFGHRLLHWSSGSQTAGTRGLKPVFSWLEAARLKVVPFYKKRRSSHPCGRCWWFTGNPEHFKGQTPARTGETGPCFVRRPRGNLIGLIDYSFPDRQADSGRLSGYLEF
jgi:hypothetical protein